MIPPSTLPSALIPAVFAATFRVLRCPAFVVPTMAIGLTVEAVLYWNAWPGAGTTESPVARQISTAIVALLARAWLDLSLIAVGIAMLRGRPPSLWRQWVHVLVALKIGAVGVLLMGAVALGTMLLVLPGVYLLLRWSQVLPAMIERRTGTNAVFMYSEAIASEHYLRILIIWVVAWSVPTLVALGTTQIDPLIEAQAIPYLAAIRMGLGWMWFTTLRAFGLALIAALYVELDTRAYAPRVTPIGPLGS